VSKRQRVPAIYEFISEGSVESLRDLCNKALESVAKGEWSEVYINYEYDEEGDGYNDCLAIVGERWETDAEMKERLKIEERQKKLDKKIKKDREDADRAIYEQLKKKFEGK
jgi:hypothetical protein